MSHFSNYNVIFIKFQISINFRIILISFDKFIFVAFENVKKKLTEMMPVNVNNEHYYKDEEDDDDLNDNHSR